MNNTTRSEPLDSGSVIVDARGLKCPAPVIALARAARRLDTGTIEVLADDVAARTDIPAWCAMKGATLVSATTQDAWDHYVVEVHDPEAPGTAP